MELFIENLMSFVFDDFEDLILTENTIFQELDEWDSMGLMLLIGMYDQKYSKSISGELINSCSTIGDLYKLLK
jgi:acyl carrier protein